MNQIEISGCSRIQEVLLRYKLAGIKLSPGAIQIALEQKVKPGKCHCLWFGGDVASITYKGYTFYISAIGDVILSLLSKTGSDEVARVKDKSNGGIFANEMAGYIENDAMIERLFKETDPNYYFNVDDSNWYELTIEDKDGHIHSDYDTLDAELIFDAIAEVADIMQDMIDDLEKRNNF